MPRQRPSIGEKKKKRPALLQGAPQTPIPATWSFDKEPREGPGAPSRIRNFRATATTGGGWAWFGTWFVFIANKPRRIASRCLSVAVPRVQRLWGESSRNETKSGNACERAAGNAGWVITGNASVGEDEPAHTRRLLIAGSTDRAGSFSCQRSLAKQMLFPSTAFSFSFAAFLFTSSSFFLHLGLRARRRRGYAAASQ